jgi:ribosomal protein S18 acetylase RimI-like enzyme
MSSESAETISIRLAEAADVPGIAAVHVASWQTTYPGIVAAGSIDRRSAEVRTEQWQRLFAGDVRVVPIVFVAHRPSGEIVGFISGGAVRGETPGFDAELAAIYIVKDAQGIGLGRRLVRRLTDRLIDRGFRSMLVRVLADNPACRFYEALGARLVSAGVYVMDEREYPERCYGWDDIRQVGDGVAI